MALASAEVLTVVQRELTVIVHQALRPEVLHSHQDNTNLLIWGRLANAMLIMRELMAQLLRSGESLTTGRLC